MVFIDYSSSFSTSLPSRLDTKLLNLGLSTHCSCGSRTFYPTSNGQAGPHLPPSLTLRHWRTTRLHDESAPLIVLHIWLHSRTLRKHKSTCRWHSSGGTDLKWGWDSLQRQSLQTSRMMYRKEKNHWASKKPRNSLYTLWDTVRHYISLE